VVSGSLNEVDIVHVNVQPAPAGIVFLHTLRLRNYLLPLLALALVAATVLAWRQYEELVVLRVSALGGDERTALEARLAEMKKRNFELQSQLAALQLDKKLDDTTTAETVRARDAAKESAAVALAKLAQMADKDSEGASKKDADFEVLAAMADMPEFQKLLALEQRGKVDAKFAALFRKLKLSPDEQSRLETLLADKQSAFADAMIAARGQGLSGKEARELANTVANASQKDINNSIKDLLGPQRFNQYQNYERTAPQREAVDQLAQRLSYTSSPLTPRQQDQLVQVLATTAVAPKPVTNPATGVTATKNVPIQPIAQLPGSLANLGIGSAPSAPITTAAVAQSQTFLSPQQLAALQQMQQQQQAQQTLNSVLNGKPAPAAPKPPKVKPGK